MLFSGKADGVFTLTDNVVTSAEIPKLGTRIKADNSTMVKQETNKSILDSLPVLEKLRSLSRAGSIKDDGSVSEVGDVSDKDSIVSGAYKSKKKTKGKATNAKSNGKGKRFTRSNKGKGRRTIFKKKPVKALPATATPTTSHRVYHDGQFWNMGDIVSVVSVDDDDIYYAQLRGFLTDQYSDKYGVITWLLPTQDSPPPNEGMGPYSANLIL